MKAFLFEKYRASGKKADYCLFAYAVDLITRCIDNDLQGYPARRLLYKCDLLLPVALVRPDRYAGNVHFRRRPPIPADILGQPRAKNSLEFEVIDAMVRREQKLCLHGKSLSHQELFAAFADITGKKSAQLCRTALRTIPSLRLCGPSSGPAIPLIGKIGHTYQGFFSR